MVGQWIQWTKIRWFHSSSFQWGYIYISWLGYRLPHLISWIYFSYFLRSLVRYWPSSPIAVDTGWLNNPNLLLLLIKSDSDRMDILKLSLCVMYFYCDWCDRYNIPYDAPKIYTFVNNRYSTCQIASHHPSQSSTHN